MSRFGLLALVVLTLGAGAGSYLATVAPSRPATAPASRPSPSWLDLSGDELRAVEAADPSFGKESAELAETLRKQRLALAGLLDDLATPNERIRLQVEEVITAHDALERRVAEHLLAIRPHLTPEQQKRLLGLAATCVRRAARYRWRHGWQGDDDRRGRGPGGGLGRGRGFRGGRGQGGGRGHGQGGGWNRDN